MDREREVNGECFRKKTLKSLGNAILCEMWGTIWWVVKEAM